MKSINKDGEVIGFNIYEDEKSKYGLFKTKLDKTPTKAFTQFKEQAIMVDSEIGIAYKEKEREYKDRNNETRVGINKNIMWFSTPSTIEEYAEQKKFTLEQEKTINDFREEDEDLKIENIPF